jgi:hypothetical protein
MLPDEPPRGWRTLQERAQHENDPKKLAAIIDEMNRLLTEHARAIKREKESHFSDTKNKSAGE